ncbi:DUF488 family protein [Candidatus Saccharibacteria bacterium]|nr:DUF488 family protein [Candidatus Saccharibacteria bacterium]
MANIIYKRVYDLDESDRQRVLVDRLWPRGKSKEELNIIEWAKDITPSTELRQNYHKGKLVYLDFAAAYQRELENNDEAAAFIAKLNELLNNGDVTLTYTSKDVEHSHMPTLRNFIAKKIPR